MFYFGNRIGTDGVPFKTIKFRTMFGNIASYNGAKITSKNDGLITREEKWL